MLLTRHRPSRYLPAMMIAARLLLRLVVSASWSAPSLLAAPALGHGWPRPASLE